eukprot:scaffold3155_cov358-Prasinococcus_capsulatus_cf.AAC.8
MTAVPPPSARRDDHRAFVDGGRGGVGSAPYHVQQARPRRRRRRCARAGAARARPCVRASVRARRGVGGG